MNIGPMRLRLSERAAEQMKGASRGAPKAKTPEQIEKEAARAEKEAHRAPRREQLKAERNTAFAADESLAEALATFNDVVRAINSQERDKARVLFQDANRRLAQAEQRLAEAIEATARAKVAMERMEQLSTSKLPEAVEKLQAVWQANDDAWQRMPQTFRKANRNRSLKNQVKMALGLKD